MNKREARIVARRHAAAWLDNLLGAGWPYEMADGGDPPELKADCERMIEAMKELIDRLEPKK